MSKNRKRTKSGDALLFAHATLGSFALLSLAVYFNFFVVEPDAKPAEHVTLPVVLKPLAEPLPKLTKSQKIVATAHLGESENWGETLDQAYRRGWRP